MIESSSVYHALDSELSSRDRTDLVLRLCDSGQVDQAAEIVTAADDADAQLARGVVEYWQARTGGSATYENAKDLLSCAGRVFSDTGDAIRSQLCDVWLGLCYWRQGQSAEALVLLERSAQSSDSHVKFIALINLSVLHTDHARWRSALAALSEAQPFFDSEPSLSWKGKFFQQRGVAYKQAFDETKQDDYLDRALTDYEAASEQYEIAGNLRFEAAIVNNVANLYRVAGLLNRAHVNADRAISLYQRLGDRSHLGHAKDTKALILLDEGQYKRAKYVADQAVALLSSHGEGWLSIPLVTRGKILCRTGQFKLALRDFQLAAENAEAAGDLKRAADVYLAAVNALGNQVSVHFLIQMFRRVDELDGDARTAAALEIMSRVPDCAAESLSELKQSERSAEAEIILKALEEAGGSVTRAANLLNKTHGGLAHILRTRHPELLAKCRPIIKRRKTIGK